MAEMLDSGRGMTPTRKKFIQDHRKKADTYGPDLPISIGKPPKQRPLNKAVECSGCGKIIFVSKFTTIVICSCGELVQVNTEIGVD